MLPGFAPLPITWATRYERRPLPRIVLDQSTQGGVASSSPIPQDYQTDFPADITAQLRNPVGHFPLGPALPRYQRALAAGIDIYDAPELEWGTPPPAAVPVAALANSALHTNYQLTITDGNDTQIKPGDRYCCYLLIVNNGANDALIGFDKTSDSGLLIASGGGFVELQFGTQSAVRAQGDGGATTLSIVEGRLNPAELCRLACDTVQ